MGFAAAMTPKCFLLLVATSFLVTIATVPVVSAAACPSDRTLVTTSGQAYSNAAITTTGLACNNTTPPRWQVGVHTVFCTDVNDDTNCTFTVTVTDNEDPRITCPNDISRQLSVDDRFSVSWNSVTALDNVGVASSSCSPASGSSFKTFVGSAKTVTCTAVDDAGNTATCTFRVTLTDDVPPTITCPGNQTERTTNGEETRDIPWNIQTSDSVGVASRVCSRPDSNTVFSLGTTVVTCTARDAAGNDATCSFQVTILDGNPPVFTSCPTGTINKTIDSTEISWTLPTLSVRVTWDEPSAEDDDGVAPMVESSHSSGDEFPVGITDVTYNATDMAGNTKICSFSVAVEFQPPQEVSETFGTCQPTPCFNVAWTRSQDPTVSEYIISAWKGSQGESEALQDIVPNADSTYIRHEFKKQFSPGELYTIKVEAVVGQSRQLIGTMQQWTMPDMPGTIEVVPGTRSTTSVEVTWPRVSLQNVEQYRITSAGHHSGYVTKTTDKILLDNVFPNIWVNVYAVVGSGDMRKISSGRGKSVSFQDYQEESKLLALSTESTVRVYWKSNQSPSNEPHMLYIEPEDAEENYLTAFSGTQAEFTGLEPNTEYQIRLINNFGLSLSTSVKTKPGPPSNVRPTEVLNNSLTLEWDPPTEGDVESYEVYISPGDSTEPVEVSGTSHTFSSLTAMTEYFLRVVSVYDDVKSLPMTLMVTTGVTKPSPSPPLNIIAIALGVGLGVVALLLIIGIVVTCRKYRKLKAAMNTAAGYERAIPTVAKPATPRVPVKVDVDERRYENAAVADQMADREARGQKKGKSVPMVAMKPPTDYGDEYAYVAQQ
ncbi:uncharacterized protein LOC119723206 [Patiria miniata]|uniref:Uncharacterized protein n=1 Tax=Patiria miniata TaxID=46514 RepID=A0A913ZFE9_PATMI|nr:uncharacterized protein LOC119723206 [Patiria miniata]